VFRVFRAYCWLGFFATVAAPPPPIRISTRHRLMGAHVQLEREGAMTMYPAFGPTFVGVSRAVGRAVDEDVPGACFCLRY